MARHAGGNWTVGKAYGAIVTDEPYEGGVGGFDHPEHMEAYGGYLIAESVAECNRPILSAAKDLYEALGNTVCHHCDVPIGFPDYSDMVECHVCKEARAAIAKARGGAS